MSVDLDDLLEITKSIVIFRGGPGSGNWAHSGRPGKLGGSGKGGGLTRIGAKPGSSHKERREASAKHRQGGGKKATGGSKGKTGNKPESQPKPKVKEASPDADSQRLGWRSKEMADFEKKHGGAAKESAAVYDSNGKKLFETGGQETEVNFSDTQLKQMKGAVVTHNHPSTINGKKYPDGGSFSPSDVQLMFNTGASEVRAVTDNYVYMMKPKMVGGQPIKNALNFLDRRKSKVQSSLSKKYQQGKLSKDEYTVEFWHEVWKSAADEGLVTYERIKR